MHLKQTLHPALEEEHLQANLREELIGVCGKGSVLQEKDVLRKYESDHTMDLRFPFDLLVMPSSAQEVSEVMKICSKYGVPVTPRGGGTGVTGGALPLQGGLVLSMERMNKVISLNSTEGYVVAEAGVVTDDLCAAAESSGWFFPVKPSISAQSFIGGNVAMNAGGMRSCRYGSIRNFVMNLEVVLPDGTLMWTGSNVSKNATGFDLTGLFVGSEGILGIITSVVFKLVRKPEREAVLAVYIESLEDCCALVEEIRSANIEPSAVELVCDNALRLDPAYNARVPADKKQHLLIIELQAANAAELEARFEKITGIIGNRTGNDIITALSDAEKAALWAPRLNIGSFLHGPDLVYHDIDACVPLQGLLSYLRHVEKVFSAHDLRFVSFGHALNGNVHTMVIPGKGDTTLTLAAALEEIYRYAVSLGGVISGEHGIGMLQKKFIALQFPPSKMAVMRKLKEMFDPYGILNPGKVLS